MLAIEPDIRGVATVVNFRKSQFVVRTVQPDRKSRLCSPGYRLHRAVARFAVQLFYGHGSHLWTKGDNRFLDIENYRERIELLHH